MQTAHGRLAPPSTRNNKKKKRTMNQEHTTEGRHDRCTESMSMLLLCYISVFSSGALLFSLLSRSFVTFRIISRRQRENEDKLRTNLIVLLRISWHFFFPAATCSVRNGHGWGFLGGSIRCTTDVLAPDQLLCRFVRSLVLDFSRMRLNWIEHRLWNRRGDAAKIKVYILLWAKINN